MRVEEVMLRDFPVLDKDETLERGYKLMKRYGMDRLVATEDDRLVGVMTKGDVAAKLATLRTRQAVPGRMHISSFMTPDPVTVKPDSTVKDAASILVERDIGGLPVVDDEGKPVGLVTRWEVARLLSGRSDVQVRDLMITTPVYLKPTDTALHARQLLLQHKLIFIPVIDEEGRPIGYVTTDILADALYAFHDIVDERFRKERIRHLLVDDFMKLRPPVVKPSDSIADAYQVMSEKGAKGAVVVDDEGKPVGLVTLKEMVGYVAASL